jgi:hypothetical protein
MAQASTRDLTVSVPHKLGAAQAKARLTQGLEKLGGSSLPVTVAETWQGDRLAFHLTAMGQTLAGHADVGEDRVEVTVRLPWLLAKLAETLRPQLERGTRRALELPDGTK